MGVGLTVSKTLKQLGAPFTYLRKTVRYLQLISKMRTQNSTIVFPDEFDAAVTLPDFNFLDAIDPAERPMLSRMRHFVRRPTHEVLFRRLIAEFYERGVLDRGKSIVDIGAWISDNTIVWAKQLYGKDAKVYAIDPSAENIRFGQRLGAANAIENIEWHTSVCSDRAGVPLDFSGSLDHTSFSEVSEHSARSLVSTTIDDILGSERWATVGMMHVDVEGFEENVLRGSRATIDASRPAIVFEQHVTTEDVGAILRLLAPFGYRSMMINEILPGCATDCRNLIAFPEESDFDRIGQIAAATKTVSPHTPATSGPALIEVTLDSFQST